MFKEEKGKGLLFGLGTFGLGGVLASAFKPFRNVFGVNNKGGSSVGGWGDGLGKWVVGAGSAVLSLAGYYVSDEKLKTLTLGLGTFGMGGVLASTFSSVRKLFGFDEKSSGKPLDIINALFEANLRIKDREMPPPTGLQPEAN